MGFTPKIILFYFMILGFSLYFFFIDLRPLLVVGSCVNFSEIFRIGMVLYYCILGRFCVLLMILIIFYFYDSIVIKTLLLLEILSIFLKS